MLYNMFFGNNPYLCSVETRENNRRCLTRPRNAGAQKPKNYGQDYERDFYASVSHQALPVDGQRPHVPSLERQAAEAAGKAGFGYVRKQR